MRYRLEFKDNNNALYRVHIFKNSFGDWKELQASANPLNIQSTKGELIDSIIGTGVEIGIMVKNYDTIIQAEYEAIFTSPPQTWKVEVYKQYEGSVPFDLIFAGYVDTEMYQESYIAPPYEIILSASDGIKGLKNYEPVLEPYEKLSSIITKCLLKTGLKLDVWVMNTLTAEGLYIHTKSIFQLAQCSSNAFKKKDALSILEGVLNSFRCKIYQQNGEWRIDRTTDLYYRGGTIQEHCINNTLQSARDRNLTPKNVGDVFIGRGQTLEVNSPYGKQSIVGNDNDRGNLLPPMSDFINVPEPIEYTDSMEVNRWYFGTRSTPMVIPTIVSGSSDFIGEVVQIKPVGVEPGFIIVNEHTFGIRTLISVPVFNKGYKSDDIKISYKIKCNFVNPAYLDTLDNPAIIVPMFISLGSSDKNWINSTYENNKFKGTFIGSKSSDMYDMLVYRRIAVNSLNCNDVLTDTIQLSISSEESNENDVYGNIKINQTLPQDIDLRVGFSNFFFNEKRGGLYADINLNPTMINNYQIGDIEVNVKEIEQYNNTYTGVLQQDYLREADKLNIDLWNPVKGGSSDDDRGLVSSTSRWVNLNKGSNIYNTIGIYSDSRNFDKNAGLGLFYDLRELSKNGGNYKDLGHRLPVVLLNSWFNQFSETQDIISGTIKTNKLLNFDKTYNITGRANKQFIMIARNYNCRNCQLKAVFHELKDEEIITNV